AFPLNALAFFYAGWRLAGDLRPAFIAGVIGALYPFHGEHYSHLELEWTFFTPLALVALLDVIVRPSARRGAWLGALIAAQWLASMYLGLMLLTFAIPFGALAAVAWRPPLRPFIRSLAPAAVIVAVAFAALGLPYLRTDRARGGRSLALAGAFSAAPIESLVSGALAFDWSLGTNGLTYDDLYHWLLPYRGLRVPARFSMFVGTALVLLGAIGTRRI